jgi:tetratricopeptide (TPR) repeat protein
MLKNRRPLGRTTQPNPKSSKEWLETEIGNLRAVMEHAVEQRDARLGLPMAVLMRPFWLDLGHVSEGRQRLADLMQIERAAHTRPQPVEDSYTKQCLRKLESGFGYWSNLQIDESTEVPHGADPWWTEAIKLAAYLAAAENDYEKAKAHLEELRAAGEEFGDEQLIESSIVPLGMLSQNEAEPGSELYGTLLELLQDYRDSGNDRGAARILISLGMLARRRYDVRAAEGFFKESLELSTGAGNLINTAIVCLELAYISNPEDAVLLAEEGLQAARSSGDPRLTAMVLYRVGQLSAAVGNLPAAAADFEEALRLSEELGHRWLAAISLFLLASLALQSGNLDQAKSYLERAEQIQQALGNKAAVAYTILTLAKLSMMQGQGQEQYWKAIEIFRSLANEHGEAHCLLELGDGALTMSNYEEALKRFQEARAIFDEIKDSTSAANSIVRMALVRRERSEYEEAQKLYEEALTIFQASKADALAANCVRLLGDLQRKQSNFDRARAYYEEALKLYRNINNKSGIANLLFALGDLNMDLKE